MSSEIDTLERAEIEAFADLYRAASPEVVKAAGLSIVQRERCVVLATNRIDVLALNRAMGLGLSGPVSDELLDRVLEELVLRESARFFVPVAPVTGHEQLLQALAARGLRHYNNWIRLWRGVADIPTPEMTALDVREIDRESSATFGSIVSTAFGYPPAVAPLAGLTVGRPGWRHYLAYDGDRPVASGAMFLAGDTAWFGFAATEAGYRRRGAQQALVVRRLRDAADAGCVRISVETAEDSVLKDAPSYRNLKRLGFAVAYARPNYLWAKPAG